MTQDIDKNIAALTELKELIEDVAAKDYGTKYKTSVEYIPKFYGGSDRYHHHAVNVNVIIDPQEEDSNSNLVFGVTYINDDIKHCTNQCRKFVEKYAFLADIEKDDLDVFHNEIEEYFVSKQKEVSKSYKVRLKHRDKYVTLNIRTKEGNELVVMHICHDNYKVAIQEIDIVLEPYLRTKEELDKFKSIDRQIAGLQALKDYFTEVDTQDFGNFSIEPSYMLRFGGANGIYHNGVKVEVIYKDVETYKRVAGVCYYNGNIENILTQCKRFIESYSNALQLPLADEYENYSLKIRDYLKDKLDPYRQGKLSKVQPQYRIKTDQSPDGVFITVDDFFGGKLDHDSAFYSPERISSIFIQHGNYAVAVEDIDLFLKPYINPILS